MMDPPCQTSEFLFRLLAKYICNPRPVANRIIHVKGQNGSGKSIFIRTFLNYLYKSGNFCGNAYIIDTERKYTKANMDHLINFGFQSRIHIIVRSEFSELLGALAELERMDLPPKSLIILDSLSNILKYIGADYDSFPLLQQFNNVFLSRLVSLITKKDLFCIFVHHISFNPMFGDMPSYYGSVVQNLEGIWLSLEKTIEIFEDCEPFFENSIALSYSEYSLNAVISQFCLRYKYSLESGKFVLGEKVDG